MFDPFTASVHLLLKLFSCFVKPGLQQNALRDIETLTVTCNEACAHILKELIINSILQDVYNVYLR